MAIVASFPSKSGGPPHIVSENGIGNFSCSCKAGSYNVRCWAIKIVESEREHLKMMRAWQTPLIEKKSDFDPRKEVMKQLEKDRKEREYWDRLAQEYYENFKNLIPKSEPLKNEKYDPYEYWYEEKER